MSMNLNTSKIRHDGEQAEVSTFKEFSSNKAIDMMVFKAINLGSESLEAISSHYRIPSDLIKKSVTQSLFVIEEDSIKLA